MQKARTRRTNRAAGKPAGDLAETAKQLSEAEALRLAGKLDKARRACAGLLNQFPDYPAAHHTMGLVLADMHNYSQALSHLVRAQMHDPDNWKVLTALAGVYLRMGASAMAARTLKQAATLNPGDAGILMTLGEVYRDDREYELAVDAFRNADAAGGDGAAQYGLGLCLMELGQMEDAAGIFEDLVAKGNRSITALNALSEMAPDLVKCDLLALIEDAERLPDQSQEFFDMARGFTLAAVLSSAGRHQEAWSACVAANEAVAGEAKQDWLEQAKFQDSVLEGARKAGVRITAASTVEEYPVSLFVLGVSRSGKTTAERLIATHDDVKPGYENPIVENSVRQTFQNVSLPSRTNAIELPPGLDPKWREAYLGELVKRAGNARVFTNTHPGQIENALRIAATLPNVRFILMKRNLQDTALRIFLKQYRTGNPYAYDLRHIQDHITWYNQMIDVLAEKAPAITRVISYEEMIADPSTVLKAAADLCGLPETSVMPPVPGDDRGCSAPYAELMLAMHRS